MIRIVDILKKVEESKKEKEEEKKPNPSPKIESFPKQKEEKPKESPAKVPIEVSTKEIVKAPIKAPSEPPAKVSEIAPSKPIAKVPIEVSKEVPAKPHEEVPPKAVVKAPIEAPKEVPANPHIEVPQKVAAKAPEESPSDIVHKTIKTLADILNSSFEKTKGSDGSLVVPIIEKVIDQILSGNKDLMKYCDISSEASKNLCMAVKEAILACRIGKDAGYEKTRLTSLFGAIIVYKIESFPDAEKNKLNPMFFKELLLKAGLDIADKNFEKIIKSIEIYDVLGSTSANR